MGREINLMSDYPKSIRNLTQRLEEKTLENKEVAQKFGKDFFDGERKYGYGGFYYNSKFWEPVIPSFQKRYELSKNSSILDIGCAKGFMLYDFQRHIPGISIQGIDISTYAIENAKEEVKSQLQVANAINLPFEDNTFDLVISISTLHNLEKVDMKQAIKEIMRVTKKDAFITLDAYRNEDEKYNMDAWNLTAKTVMNVEHWKLFFEESDYNGDYYWFIP